jgi:hypothetical protein
MARTIDSSVALVGRSLMKLRSIFSLSIGSRRSPHCAPT